MSPFPIKSIPKVDVDSNLTQDSDVGMRRSLPPEFFERKPIIFILKLSFALALIVAATSAICLSSNLVFIGIAMIVNGFMFAHLVELQHECLHGHAFCSPSLNSFFGVFCGIFVMSSYAHYRYNHLRHHIWLGTPRNLEHFDYLFSNLDCFWGFASAFFDLSRYKIVFKILANTALSRPIQGVDDPRTQREIKMEYVLFSVIFGTSVIYTYLSPALFWPIALSWWIPALLIAEGVHYMIELPEHFGLNTMTEPNVFYNTRTITASRLLHWFVNGNDLHTAHHYHHGVPMCNIKKLHKAISHKIAVVEPSYYSLYLGIFKGKIRQDMLTSCMKR